METLNFKPKTIYIPRINKTTDKYIQLSLDIGFSGVKGFSPISVFCIPAYARRIDPSDLLSITNSSGTDIIYKNLETGEMWIVGELAMDMTNASEATENISTLYGRNRYDSPMFAVLENIGLGIGMIANEQYPADLLNLRKPVHLETGLPPDYMPDKEYLISALAGRKHFAIKCGFGANKNKWTEFDFTLSSENIDVIEQPVGTLFSLIFDNEGKRVKEANEILSKRTLIFDGGFGTLDVFSLKKIKVERKGTFENLGMKRVFAETCAKIKNTYNTSLNPLSLQQYLEEGKFRFYDRKSETTALVPFEDMLEESSTEIMNEAINEAKLMYDDLIYHDYFVVTGGTGDAWFEGIKKRFSGMETLKVVKGTNNDDLPAIFSNVRGYYYYQYNLLRK